MELPVNYDEITQNERRLVREEYIRHQTGRCYHCGEFLKKEPPHEITKHKVNKRFFPKGFFNNPMHLHHNHNTGMTIGVVHAYCNAVLWQFHGE